MSASAGTFAKSVPSTWTSIWSSRWRSVFSTATSFSAHPRASDWPCGSDDLDLERGALLQQEPALRDRAERRPDVVDLDLGEEPEATEVDPEHGDAAVTAQVGRAQEGAVPAEGDGQVELVAKSSGARDGTPSTAGSSPAPRRS